MSKLITTERAHEDRVWVKIDKTFMEGLPTQFSHLECPNCTSARFNLATFNGSVKVGCANCSWEFEIKYEYVGPANIVMPV